MQMAAAAAAPAAQNKRGGSAAFLATVPAAQPAAWLALHAAHEHSKLHSPNLSKRYQHPKLRRPSLACCCKVWTIMQTALVSPCIQSIYLSAVQSSGRPEPEACMLHQARHSPHNEPSKPRGNSLRLSICSWLANIFIFIIVGQLAGYILVAQVCSKAPQCA